MCRMIDMTGGIDVNEQAENKVGNDEKSKKRLDNSILDIMNGENTQYSVHNAEDQETIDRT